MPADEVAIELTPPGGAPVRVVWSPEAFAGARPAEQGGWRIEGELDWGAVDALRVVSARLPDGRALGLASLRPSGAAGHGDDAIAAVLAVGDSEDRVPEPLLSVEYAEGGIPRRLALELYPGAETPPLRIAADVTAASSERDDELSRIRAALEVRLDGKRAAGTYESLAPSRAPSR